MAFYLGKESKSNLKGVHPDLVSIVEEAISITPVDFCILANGGLRTASMQNSLYRKGASKLDGRSRKSKHQKQKSGYGEAVDLVPWVKSPRWEWPLIYPIAASVAYVSKKNNVPLLWGGVWDRKMADYIPHGCDDLNRISEIIKAEVRAYCVRHPGPDFIDGPHYEMITT